MNKIERALMTRAKELLFEYAADELERIRKEIQEKNTQTLLNVFNTGIMLDLDRLKDHGINQVLKAIKNSNKINSKKATK